MKILYDEGVIDRDKVIECLEGWIAYALHGNTYKYRKHILKNFNRDFPYKTEKTINNKVNYRNFIKKIKLSKLTFSVQQTLFMYKKRLSIKEIALNRVIKESTVWEHLINLIEYRQLSVWEILPREKICEILSKVYSRKDRLKNIKNRLNNPAITYNEIDCVMASVRSKKKRFKKCPRKN